MSVLATGLRPRQRARCSLRRRPSTAPPSDADVDAMQRDTWTLEGSGGVGGGGGGGGLGGQGGILAWNCVGVCLCAR